MADDLVDGFRRLRVVPSRPAAGTPGRRVAFAPAPSEQAVWCEELMTFLRAEVRAAARRGVISTADSEQLLARLGLVIDQALTSR
jgi:hypothetical protein